MSQKKNFMDFCRYPVRWTDEANKAITQLEELFGDKFYKYGILVMTHGDAFEKKQKKRKKSKSGDKPETFEEYISKQSKIYSYFLLKLLGF